MDDVLQFSTLSLSEGALKIVFLFLCTKILKNIV